MRMTARMRHTVLEGRATLTRRVTDYECGPVLAVWAP